MNITKILNVLHLKRNKSDNGEKVDADFEKLKNLCRSRAKESGSKVFRMEIRDNTSSGECKVEITERKS